MTSSSSGINDTDADMEIPAGRYNPAAPLAKLKGVRERTVSQIGVQTDKRALARKWQITIFRASIQTVWMDPHKSNRLLRVGPSGPALFCYLNAPAAKTGTKMLAKTGPYRTTDE